MSDYLIGMVLNEYDIRKTCCFTGHRSSKLPGEGRRDYEGMKRLESTLEYEILKLIDEKKVIYFISGMATGVDLICAEIVIRLKKSTRPWVELICAIPYVGQMSEMKTPQEKYLYSMIQRSSAKTVTLSDKYYKECYRDRNMFMVDNSSHMLAVCRPSLKGSGTMQTINYAEKNGLDIKLIDLDENPQFL